MACLVLAGCERSANEPSSLRTSVLGATQCLSEPGAPTWFSAEATSEDEIFLTWTPVTAPPECEVTYTLFRSTDSDQLGDLISENAPDDYFVDTGLAPSTTYHYTLVAFTEYGSNDTWPSTQATTFTSIPVCEARPWRPVGLTAKAGSSNQINLAWDPVLPPLGCSLSYALYRDTTSGFSPSSANQVAAQLTRPIFTDTGLSPSTTYYYLVRATDEVGLSDNSEQVSATTLADGPACTAAPSTPTGAKAIASSSSQINLSWSAVAPPSGCTVSYSVYRSKTSDVTPSVMNQVATGLPTTSFSDSGLAPSTTYYYLVTASDAAGTSGHSGPVSATTASDATCATIPAAPTGFTAKTSSSSQIDLSWNAVTPPPGCSVTYALFRDTNSTFTPGWGTLIAAQLSKTSYSDVGLAPAVTYYYIMQAVDAAGISANSAKVNATTQQGPNACMSAPSATPEITATPLSPTRIDVSWKAVAPPVGCSVTYAVFRSLNKDFSSPTHLASGLTSTSFSSTGLSPSTTYYYGVRTHTSKGYAEATPVGATTPSVSTCSAAPPAPAGVTATAKSPSQIDLSWNTVAPPAGCPGVTYTVYRSTTNHFTPSDTHRVATNLSGASFSSTGLTPSTTYYFVVRAIDAAGSSPSSSQASATTGADSACTTAPFAPTGLTATAYSPSQINLSWGAVTPPTGCSALTYAVYQSTDSSFVPSDANRVATNLPSPSYSSTGLTPSTTYHFIVRAVDVAGASPDSNRASAATKSGSESCSVAPSAPAVSATASSASQINLSWNSVSSPPGCSAVSYVVHQSTDRSFVPSETNRVATNLSSTGYSSTGLSPSTTYFFVVRALNGAGTSPDSNRASAATRSDSGTCSAAPAAPTGLAGTARSSSQVDLSWSASTPPSGCSVSYAVFQGTSESFSPSDANRVASNLPSPSYSVTGLSPLTTYYFRVRAVNAAGTSPTSSEASVTTLPSKGGCAAAGASGDALLSLLSLVALTSVALRARRRSAREAPPWARPPGAPRTQP